MEAIKKDTAQIMAQYNFNKPIAVKILYDDDEETSEKIITQDKSVQYDRRQLENIPSTNVELNFGEQAQARKSEQIKKCVKNDMLNEAIGYMSTIMEVQLKFSQVFETLTLTEAANFKQKYLDMKHLLFKKCFMVAKCFLLPQKRNELFIQNVIMAVLNKTNSKTNVYKNIRLLYAELLAWTETQLSNDKKNAGTRKRQNLNTPQPNHTVGHLNPENRKRRFPFHGIPDANASSNITGNKSVVNVESNFSLPNHTNRSFIEQDHTNCQIAMQTTEQTYTYPLVVNIAPSDAVYFPPNSTTYYNPQKNYLSESNALNQEINTQDLQNYSSTPTFAGNSTVGYQDRLQTNVSQILQHSNLSNLEKNGVDVRDISRSSVSRDSGFMSPDILFSPRESTNTNFQSFPPLWPNATITHDTLKPNVTSTNKTLVACHECGRKTNLVCLGCSQVYYCSSVCQVAQWQLHKSRCRNSLTS